MSQARQLTERSSRVVAAAKLHRHVARKRAGRFLTEGPNLVGAALRSGVAKELFVTQPAAARFAALLADTEVPVLLVTERAAKALSDTVTPVGLVAVCERVPATLEAIDSPRLVVVGAGISEPGNAGTLIRLSHAMGAAAVVLTAHSVDPYNAKCLRASAGSVFAIPVVVEEDAGAVVAALRGMGLAVLATAVGGEATLDDVDLSAPTAWVFGSEAHGLPRDVAAAADTRVRIPMPGAAESLNVAAAAAICLYLSARAQRD